MSRLARFRSVVSVSVDVLFDGTELKMLISGYEELI